MHSAGTCWRRKCCVVGECCRATCLHGRELRHRDILGLWFVCRMPGMCRGAFRSAHKFAGRSRWGPVQHVLCCRRTCIQSENFDIVIRRHELACRYIRVVLAMGRASAAKMSSIGTEARLTGVHCAPTRVVFYHDVGLGRGYTNCATPMHLFAI